LHIDAGFPSLFAYCMARLGLTEDEAYRRISVARLARRAPIVCFWIAEGRLSLSVAALLQPYALAPELPQLIEAVAGKSVKQARETLAAFFPRPDIVSSIRKLPRPACEAAPMASARAPLFETAACEIRSAVLVPVAPSSPPNHSAPTGASAPVVHASQAPPAPSVGRPPSLTEPLSPGRYKIQFTADAALKGKLELARDLLRHAIPSGDLAAIVHRALDLLVTELHERHCGARDERKRPRSQSARRGATMDASTAASAKPEAPGETAVKDTSITGVHAETSARATRRAVWARDGFRCTWHGPDGGRCSSRAWLEQDHRTPRALGGPMGTQNLRVLCRAHNRRAAELVFGRRHIEKAIIESRDRRRARRGPPE